MSNSNTYLSMLINKQSKRICNTACCNRTILAPCSLAALKLIPPLQKNLNYTFVSEQNNFLTEIMSNNPFFIGADVASSIFLNKIGNQETYLWFFGDTFYGTIENGERNIISMPRNSIGLFTISNRDYLSSNINHYITIYDNQPGQNVITYGFFSPYQSDINSNPLNYWPINAIYINNNMYVICEKVQATSLNIVGVDILKLNTIPYDDPSMWTYEFISTIPDIQTFLTIGNTFITSNGYVYLFGSQGTSYNGFVTKISYGDFINGNWFYGLLVYTNENQWKNYYSISIPKILYSPLPLTSTITWNQYMKKWLMISIDLFYFGPKVGLFYSDDLNEEWEGPIFIYEIPSNYLINSNIVYYAPFFHNEFISDKKPSVFYWSYNLNSFNSNNLINNLFLYTPKIIETKIDISFRSLC